MAPHTTRRPNGGAEFTYMDRPPLTNCLHTKCHKLNKDVLKSHFWSVLPFTINPKTRCDLDKKNQNGKYAYAYCCLLTISKSIKWHMPVSVRKLNRSSFRVPNKATSSSPPIRRNTNFFKKNRTDGCKWISCDIGILRSDNALKIGQQTFRY